MILDSLWKYSEETFELSEPFEPVLKLIHDFPSVDDEYKECLSRGEMYAFSKSLRIFGLTNDSEARNILKWNNPDTWKSWYKGFFTDVWSFAEDVFGFQYLFDRNGVVQLNIETGELQSLCKTFSEWIHLILKETKFYTGYPIAERWNETHPDEIITGKLHLCPIIPFVCGGNYDMENLFLLDALKCLSLKADIARQIKDLPDGTQIKFNFVD